MCVTVEYDFDKPCLKLRYCPYGILVEDFPVAEGYATDLECGQYGHVCPVFLVAEGGIDEEDDV